MDDFSYAHRDTSEIGAKGTVRFNVPRIPSALEDVRRAAFAREIPVAGDETLAFLMTQTAACGANKILELGTAVGTTAIAMACACPNAKIITVERDENFYKEALANFKKCGVSERVEAVCGDAGEIIAELDGAFDFIFMDCAKVQYIKYLPRLKQLLAHGGVLAADDVLLYGWASGETEVPKKRKMLAQHIEEYLYAVSHDSELLTCVLKVGDGIALSVKTN